MIAAMIMPPLPFGRIRTNCADYDPTLGVLRTAVKSRDWPSVSQFFAQLPARSDQSLAVTMVGSLARSERFLQRVVDSERDSSLARTLLGARLIELAWKARSAHFARYVSAAQWEVFYDYLRRAERLLSDATAIDPGNASAWTMRLTTCRGLGLGIDEGHRRYERVAEHCDSPYGAQMQMIQQLSPKWSGTLDRMHAFARECLNTATPGSLSGAVVADAHVEHAFTYDYLNEIEEYLVRREVHDELHAAAAATVLHPDHQPEFGSVDAHSFFAYAFYHGGHYQSATPHFTALSNRVSLYPWQVLPGQKPAAAFRSARRTVRSH
jgi:hypothetical protein